MIGCSKSASVTTQLLVYFGYFAQPTSATVPWLITLVLISSPPLLYVQKLEPDEQRTRSLMSTQVQHPNEIPPGRNIHESDRRNSEYWVACEAVIALDQQTQEGQLVILVLPV